MLQSFDLTLCRMNEAGEKVPQTLLLALNRVVRISRQGPHLLRLVLDKETTAHILVAPFKDPSNVIRAWKHYADEYGLPVVEVDAGHWTFASHVVLVSPRQGGSYVHVQYDAEEIISTWDVATVEAQLKAAYQSEG